MPAVKPEAESREYDIYPVFNIGNGKIFRGLNSLVKQISDKNIVIFDGFSGVSFDLLKQGVDTLLKEKHSTTVQWINANDCLRPEAEIDEMILPFLGGDDPLFGTRANLMLIDFFDSEKLRIHLPEDLDAHYIIYGTGASLFPVTGFLIYFDLPKNELQYRARAGTVTNLGASRPHDPKSMYKRYYFVDWVILGRHRKEILGRIDIMADNQRTDDITWVSGVDFRTSINEMSHSVLRARPWFEPGTWGGSWIKDNIPMLSSDVPNYAWSFELITPENGLIIESSGILLEFAFEFLMFQESEAILGDCHERFGTEFPIRFDFLDTINGGNLSIQCHPLPEYMKANFGENFTQEETYYILEAKDDAVVYLGFQENIDKNRFGENLKNSFKNGSPVDIVEFVQKHPSKKHDLFLIPYGTIHGSGMNNLVLEISSTPYIFTFKMYDWLRPDLDGKPRQLNIERGMENLFFERKGDKVMSEFVSDPVLLDEGSDWQLFHLKTHPTHLYDIYRYHFKSSVNIKTGNKLNVLSLVEGESIIVRAGNRKGRRFNYAETFVVPAAAGAYQLENEAKEPAIVVLAFVK